VAERQAAIVYSGAFRKIAVKAYEIYVNFPFNILLIPSYSGAILVKVGDK
jgi:hypothetical protein